MKEPKDCRCGHPYSAHEHYRAGLDCSRCCCPQYQRHIWLLFPRQDYPPYNLPAP